MCKEGMKRSWDAGCGGKQTAHGFWHMSRLDAVDAESGADRPVALLPSGESGLGKLRALSAHSSIDGKDNATVGLFVVQLEGISHKQQAIAETVGQQGGIDSHVVAFKVKVVLVLGPQSITISLMASGIAGKGTIPHPLNTVDCRMEKEGKS